MQTLIMANIHMGEASNNDKIISDITRLFIAGRKTVSRWHPPDISARGFSFQYGYLLIDYPAGDRYGLSALMRWQIGQIGCSVSCPNREVIYAFWLKSNLGGWSWDVFSIIFFSLPPSSSSCLFLSNRYMYVSGCMYIYIYLSLSVYVCVCVCAYVGV